MALTLLIHFWTEDTFENMDESFKEIASMLQFRDKQQERKQREEARRTGTLTEDDKDMAEWDKEMKVWSTFGFDFSVM